MAKKIILASLFLPLLFAGTAAAATGNQTAANTQRNLLTDLVTASINPDGTALGTNGLPSILPNVYTYQWQRCSSTDVNACVAIPGATQPTYPITAEDKNQFLSFCVIADIGTPQCSTPTAVNTDPNDPTAPQASSPPTVNVDPSGGTASGSNGTWDSSATGYTYQWQRCLNGESSCTNITGATNNNYTITSSDGGAQLRLCVTATNSAGATNTSCSPLSSAIGANCRKLIHPKQYRYFRLNGHLHRLYLSSSKKLTAHKYVRVSDARKVRAEKMTVWLNGKKLKARSGRVKSKIFLIEPTQLSTKSSQRIKVRLQAKNGRHVTRTFVFKATVCPTGSSS